MIVYLCSGGKADEAQFYCNIAQRDGSIQYLPSKKRVKLSKDKIAKTESKLIGFLAASANNNRLFSLVFSRCLIWNLGLMT